MYLPTDIAFADFSCILDCARNVHQGCHLTLTRNVFKAGASHYGVADLQLLAAETHKFESRSVAYA